MIIFKRISPIVRSQVRLVMQYAIFYNALEFGWRVVSTRRRMPS